MCSVVPSLTLEDIRWIGYDAAQALATAARARRYEQALIDMTVSTPNEETFELHKARIEDLMDGITEVSTQDAQKRALERALSKQYGAPIYLPKSDAGMAALGFERKQSDG